MCVEEPRGEELDDELYEEDTIAAIATAVGEGGIGIVRLSGPQAVEVARRVFRPRSNRPWPDRESHRMRLGVVVDPENGEMIDEALVAFMRAPHSYTCEDVVEIQSHGGRRVLELILDALLRAGARLAEPGEFTKRAFLNGRIDLAQAEAVIDVIRAESEAGLRAAARQLEGHLSRRVAIIREEIVGLLAQIEALLDFPEDDIPEMSGREMLGPIEKAHKGIAELLAGACAGVIQREGVEAVIAGRPNVGKSSLLNHLVQSERAIVTDIPGTTRDIIEESVELGGIPLRLMDTAGIRETGDLVERVGVERTEAALERAQLVLYVLDASEKLADGDRLLLERLSGREVSVVVCANKIDLGRRLREEDITAVCSARVVWMSLKTGEGTELLEEAVREAVFGDQLSPVRPEVARRRHVEALRLADEALSRAAQTAGSGLPGDLVSIDLREALEQLGRITGESVEEDVLDKIFSEFCIGK